MTSTLYMFHFYCSLANFWLLPEARLGVACAMLVRRMHGLGSRFGLAARRMNVINRYGF